MLPDFLRPGLDVVFTGTSVATASAARGHYYSGPGNKFWELVWDAGLTGDRILTPEQDSTVLTYGIGLTDLVKGRAASSDSLLATADFDVAGFVTKIETFGPTFVAFNGVEASRRVARYVSAAVGGLGPCDWRVGSSRIFVLPSSSGASADRRNFAPKSSKAEWWRELGALVRASDRR